MLTQHSSYFTLISSFTISTGLYPSMFVIMIKNVFGMLEGEVVWWINAGKSSEKLNVNKLSF